MISYLDLAARLPLGAFDSPATNELLFNFGVLNPSDPSESMIKALAEFMDALARLNREINEARAKQNPPLKPLSFCLRDYVGTPDNPQLQYTLTFPVNRDSFVENVLDPTT
jgi:hypothetical protein